MYLALGHSSDIRDLNAEQLQYISKIILLRDYIEHVWDKLPEHVKADVFDEIRYELNGAEIDRNRNVGITSTLKNYVTVSSDRSVILRNAGWDAQTTPIGYFNFSLYVLLGFCEDYKRVMINLYDDLNLDFDKNRCAILYDLYTRFCKGYYGYEYLEPSLTFTTFLRNGPFVIIDCSRQNKCFLTLCMYTVRSIVRCVY
ncbi:hypothetical protein ALC56_10567 [Trachymyrmex septentrionalis]|uniref:Double jelly roll-like domain-containing protein n=1 Tax=Trachymyrmex septentrionalis TaxID=34720 RepID=A0A195F4J6_9HYME|nr:hypothetical protein ALC56_10567 [Trachymyrmex septentrionalis]